jgi:hypothetical protein
MKMYDLECQRVCFVKDVMCSVKVIQIVDIIPPPAGAEEFEDIYIVQVYFCAFEM